MTRAIVIKKMGDPEFAEAIADGIVRALDAESMEIVSAEIDRQYILENLVRVAVGNNKTPEDYAQLITKARGDYECPNHGPVYNALLGLWALTYLTLKGWCDYLVAVNREGPEVRG